MNYLEIKHLKMICALADTENMTKAAEKLFISQSALSQQLKDIESKLKIDLFFRTRKKMILTPTGKKLLSTAQHVLENLEAAELEIARLVSGDSGELKVGTQCIFCYKWLPRLMEQFHQRYPRIEFEIGNSNDLDHELESKKFDFIITAAQVVEENCYSCAPLLKDQMVCIMPKDHPLCAQTYVRFEDFSQVRLISHAEKAKTKFYQFGLKPRGIEPERFMSVAQPQAIIELVASGFGVSIFPKWAVASSLETYPIAALPITKSGLPLTWYAVWLPNNNMAGFQQEFINLIRKMDISE